MVSLSRLRCDRRYYKRHREAINKRCRDYYADHKVELVEGQRRRRENVRGRGDVCDILTKHANDVADDSERLSSDFILRQIEMIGECDEAG